MRILFWTNSAWPMMGGIQTMVHTLAQELQSLGHECMIITDQERPDLPKQTEFQGTPIFRFPFEQAFSIEKNFQTIGKILFESKKLVQQFNPDIMHAHIGIGAHASMFSMISKISKIPSIATVHGLLLREDEELPELYENIFTQCDSIASVSNAVLKQMIAHAPHLANKTQCIYNGLPTPKLTPSKPNFTPLKLLCLGRLTDEKGFDMAIGATHLLRSTLPNIELTVAGEGIEEKYLKKLTRCLNIQDAVHFLGKVHQEEALQLINESSIVLIPSHYEAFGLTALEAMQLAKPVIASDVGGLKELISNKETGLLIERNNLDEMAKAIQHLAANQDEAVKLGAAARKKAISAFSEKAMLQSYLKLYNGLFTKTNHQKTEDEALLT